MDSLTTIERTLKLLEPLAIDEHAIINLQRTMLSSKSKINRMFKLSAENDYRIIVPFTITEQDFQTMYPYTWQFLVNRSEGHKFDLLKNWIERPDCNGKLRRQKLSKYIMGIINRGIKPLFQLISS